jgi:ribonuclease HI
MKAQPLKASHLPEGSPRDIPIASQNKEPLSPRRENVADALVQAKESYLAWFDGACEPFNPGGTATFGAVIKDQDGTVLSKEHGVVGKGDAMSNNVAEYAGVLHVLKYLSSRPPGRATIHGDSNLVINQLNGNWRIKKGLYLAIAIETKELLAHLCGLGWQINFRWIPREQNEECDSLSKKGCPATHRPRAALSCLRSDPIHEVRQT